MTKLLDLLPIQYPIIQAGMVWVSGGKLAAASANAGILGVIGAGSMRPDLLEHHIQKALALTTHPERLAVNVPLMYERSLEQLQTALAHGIRIFITSAGPPKAHTQWLKDQGAIVIHVTSTPELAQKCEAAGCDAVVAEGFEAGGHNGRDEITTMALIPQVVDAVNIPVVGAGGIADGRGIAAVLSLGAQGAQLGTRFVATLESSAHDNFKKIVQESKPSSTMLMMKKHVPVRLFKNRFYEELKILEERGAEKSELVALLGKGRAQRGMLDGDVENGEIEIGQIAAMVRDIPSVADLVDRLLEEYRESKQHLPEI